jgi:hypothetical protein
MNEIAVQGLEVSPGENNIAEALDAIATLTEGEINPNNISESQDSLSRLFNTVLSPRLKIFILILFMAYFGMTPEEASAQISVPDNVTPITETITTHPTGYGLRLRAKPELNGEILGSLSTQDIVKIFGYDTATGQWAYVDKDGDEQADGFVYAGFLALSGFKEVPVISTRTITMSGEFCGADGSRGSDSGERLCAFPYGGGMIYYAHNYTNFGKTILGLSNNIGGKVSLYSNGNYLGEYEVISSHKASGTDITNILSSDALNSVNNEIATFVTTDPALEDTDNTARVVVTFKLLSKSE